ncbi:MAG: L,D-transpeptidase [Anaerolineae bacterium]|nr:L,D-transpeptidase [Anaerolineae bacterium]
MERFRLRVWARVLLGVLLGLILALSWVGGVGLAESPDQSALLSAPSSSNTNDPPVLPYAYARVVTHNVQVYETTGITPVRSLGAGYVWVSLANSQPITLNEQAWYVINENEYVQADQLSPFTPSTFQGITLTGTPGQPFAWLVFDMWASTAPGVPAGSGAPLFKRYTRVTIFEEQLVGDRYWYRIGPDQWLEQGNLGIVFPIARPQEIGPTDQWIEINLYEQTLAAYEGDRMVYATLVSSGLPYWQTPPGLFRVWVKVQEGKMSGREGYPDYYYLEDVPWTMYFNGPVALHGAYWHDKFGQRHSHGCVNLTPKDALWLYNWATPVTSRYNYTLATEENQGTWVWVHE